jgi:hypothetical protein
MSFVVLARRFALMLIAMSGCAWAVAAGVTYEGLLMLNSRDAPAKIVLQMEDSGGFLTGSMRVSGSLNGIAPIQNGRKVGGSCSFDAVLSNSVAVRLYGSCAATTFEGSYIIYYKQPKSQGKGTFRFDRKEEAAGEAKSTEVAPTSSVTATACLKANTRCLAGCPLGDADVEYLCANRCRTKLRTCKAQVGKQAAAEQTQ